MWKFIIFLFIIILAFIFCDASTVSLGIVPGKTTLLLAAGDELKLDCVHVYTGDMTDVATFSIGGQIIPMSNDRGFTILVKIRQNSGTTTRTTTLKKLNSRVTDSGRYSCHVDGQSTEIRVHIIQVTPVDAILPTQSPDALELRCNTSGMIADSDDVRWIWSYRHKTLRNSEKFNMVNKDNNGILQIKNPDRTNMGQYFCSLTQRNDVKIQQPRSVFLRASPTIDSSSVNAYQGGLELKCMASGSPIPNIIWTKDGAKLNIPNHPYVFADNNTVNSSVLLKNVNGNDDGVYSCIAYNDIEPFNSSAQIVIDPKERSALVSASGPVHGHTSYIPLIFLSYFILSSSNIYLY